MGCMTSRQSCTQECPSIIILEKKKNTLDFITYRGDSERIRWIIEDELNKEQVQLGKQWQIEANRKWKKNKMKQVCKVVDDWKCLKMWLGNNRCSKIIMDLERVKLSVLRLISLRDNGIEEIEGLNRINMPLLEQIYLNQNMITNLKSLRKAQWRTLDLLKISNNKIIQFQPLVLMIFEKFKVLVLQAEQNQPLQSEYLSWLIKLKTPTITLLKIFNQNRIKYPKLQGVLKKKYPLIELQSTY